MKNSLMTLLLCTVMVCISGCVSSRGSLIERSSRVSPGMSKAEVSRIMGKKPYSSSFTVVNGVQRERIIYRAIRADGQYSVVEFNFEKGRVVSMNQRVEADRRDGDRNGRDRNWRNPNQGQRPQHR